MASDPLRVVITGARGFLGSFLMDVLTERRFAVIPVSRQRLGGMYHVNDYGDSPDGDVLVHLAEESDRDTVNRRGASHLAESSRVVAALCAPGKYDKVIYASSGLVYGDRCSRPFTTKTPVSPSDDYTQSKLVNETIVLERGGAVVRLSNLFGRGMSAHNVLSHILSQISSEGPIFIRDDKPVRDFLHVNDAAIAMSDLVESDYSGVLNVGSGVGTRIGELAELVLKVAGQEGRSIIPTNPSQGDSRNILDISDTTDRLGWKPMRTLADGLRDLAAGPPDSLR